MITDYIKFEHTATKAKWRLDAVLSNLTHQYFQQRRKSKAQKDTNMRSAFPVGALIISYGRTDRVDAHTKRKADYCLSIDNKHLTSIYPFGDNGFSYGDLPHTDDVLIIRDNLSVSTDGITGGTLEIWIAQGVLKSLNVFLQDVEDGEFDDDMERVRASATAEPHPISL